MPHEEPDILDVAFTELTNDEPTATPPASSAPPPSASVEPIPCPDQPLTREDVLRCARSLAAQVTGLAGMLEQRALTPGQVRPEFMRGWRKWCGAFLADAQRLERTDILKLQDEAKRLDGWGRRLREWRGGIAAEVGAVQVAKREEPKAKPQGFLAAPQHWPLWVWAPVGAGCAWGAYISVRWLFRQLFGQMSDQGDREQSGESAEPEQS